MKIALLAPPYLSVPPLAYGGTEKIVWLLAEGLVAKGHDVTLFATGDSRTRAKLIGRFPKALGADGISNVGPLLPLLHYRDCFKKASEFDLIHNHAQYLAMIIADFTSIPVVHTIHGSYFAGEVPEEKRAVLQALKTQRMISISDNQRLGMPDLNYIATVYNGIVLSEYTYIEKPRGEYLLWVGRITKKKGPLEAILVSQKSGIPLVIAAAVDPADKIYFEKEIAPKVDGKMITFVGELTLETLNSLYGNAVCTLFPISWHEPFGLVMIESMSCGTPVVAYDIGSVAEVVKHGKTGFVVDKESGIDGLTHAVSRISEIQRGDCRIHVEEKFSKEKMVEGYEQVYRRILNK